MNKIKADEIMEEIQDTIDYLNVYVYDDEKAKKEAKEEAEWDDDIDTMYENAVVDKCDDDVIGMYEFFKRLERIYIKDIKPLLKECEKNTYIPEAIKMREEAFHD
jgi:hypothetical protein